MGGRETSRNLPNNWVFGAGPTRHPAPGESTRPVSCLPCPLSAGSAPAANRTPHERTRNAGVRAPQLTRSANRLPMSACDANRLPMSASAAKPIPMSENFCCPCLHVTPDEPPETTKRQNHDTTKPRNQEKHQKNPPKNGYPCLQTLKTRYPCLRINARHVYQVGYEDNKR